MLIAVVFLTACFLSDCYHCVPNDPDDLFFLHESFYDLGYRMRQNGLNDSFLKRFFNFDRPRGPTSDGDPDFFDRRRGNFSDEDERPQKPRRLPPPLRRRPFFRRRFPPMFSSRFRPMYMPYPMPLYYHP